MCKYCEENNWPTKNEETGEIEFIKSVDTYKFNDKEMCIVKPTPISKRKHEKDGLVATLQVCDNLFNMDYIPIKYCPFCGREIK